MRSTTQLSLLICGLAWNCILYFLILLYYTYLKYWFDCILARGTELYQHVLESVG
jgi:hypothetical protein